MSLDGHDPEAWPVGPDTKHCLPDLEGKIMTYEEIRTRASEEILSGSTNDAILLAHVMLSIENVGWQNTDMRTVMNAHFWCTD